MRTCACGCGRRITGKRSKHYYSTACRKAVSRLRRSRYQIQTAQGGTGRPGNGKTDTNHVTLPDTNFNAPSVSCRSCGRTLQKITGPLPCPAYCKGCVQDGQTPSANRPAWHTGVHA